MTSPADEAPWAHVHALGVLAAEGSFTAAAQRIRVSKASMSNRIRELEKAVGVPLVLRTTRSVRLTEAGQKLVDSTRHAFDDITRGMAEAADRASGPRGLLRVTAPMALGRQQIVPRLIPFLRAHPEVRIELELSDHLSSMAREGFDLAIRHAAAAPETHVAWLLCKTQAVPVASRAYLKREGTPHAPSDLGAHACLTYLRAGDRPVWTFERAVPKKAHPDRVSVNVAGAFAANNSEALRDAALEGLGIAMLPDFSAASEIAGRKLIRVLPAWRPVGGFGDGLYAIRPYSPQVPRAVQALVDYLRSSMKQGFSPASSTGG